MTTAKRHKRATGAWLRLWWPLLAVSTWAVVRLAVRFHPAPTAPWPAPARAADVDALWAWGRSLAPPGQRAPILVELLPVAAVVALVGVGDLVVCRRQRLARVLRWRWARAAGPAMGGAPKLRHVRRHGGVVDATVVLRSGKWNELETELDVNKGEMLRQLKLGRRLGSPVRAEIQSVGFRNPARVRKLRLIYLPLPLPSAFPAWEKPADGSRMFVGHTVEGPLMVDLEDVPHFQVVGETGSGKGQTIAVMEIQALRAGWLLIVLDGGNSPEHAILDPAPTVLRPMLSAMTVEERLRAAIVTVRVAKALTDARSSIAEVFGATRWVDIPAPVRAWLPRVALVVDETSTMLGESKDPRLDNLRKELRALLDFVLRAGRKFGVHVLPMVDQFAYSKVFSLASQRQAAGVIVLGNMADGHVRQVAGVSLPPVPEVPRCGHYVRYGTRRVREIRVPFHPQALRRAVEYVVAQCGESVATVGRSRPQAVTRPAPVVENVEPTQTEAALLLAGHTTADGDHLVWPPLAGQKRASTRFGGRSWPAVNVAWFAETGETPTAAQNLRPLPSCMVPHCVAARCRCEWAKRDSCANSAP